MASSMTSWAERLGMGVKARVTNRWLGVALFSCRSKVFMPWERARPRPTAGDSNPVLSSVWFTSSFSSSWAKVVSSGRSGAMRMGSGNHPVHLRVVSANSASQSKELWHLLSQEICQDASTGALAETPELPTRLRDLRQAGHRQL